MEAKDLRIGNRILFQGEITEPMNIRPTNRHDGWLINGIPDSMYDPVPLTTEWLMKLGLSNRKLWVFEIFGDNQRGFHISSEGGEWIIIEYVHQLQNLHFALTGEELTISSET